MNLSKKILKNSYSELLLFTILFLFFFQLISDLISSIYMLDLLNLELDEKVLGVLFLLSPFLIIIFRKKIPKYFLEIMALIVIVMRIITPLLNTSEKIITAGIGVGCFLIFISSYFSRNVNGKLSLQLASGLGASVLLSIFFRSLNASVDISTYGLFQIIGWILAGLALLPLLGKIIGKEETVKTESDVNHGSYNEEIKPRNEKGVGRILILSLAFTSILILNYFAFTSPTVISRWNNADYLFIVIITTIMIGLSILALTFKPDFLNKLKKWMILTWNAVFVIAMVLNIFIHTFAFPATPSSDPVIITFPLGWYYYLPLIIMLLSLPILFFDFALLSREIFDQRPNPIRLGIGFGLSGLFFVLVSLILIFTNVWGYVEPVSNIFRNLFWLPFLLVGMVMAIPILVVRNRSIDFKALITSKNEKLFLGVVLILIIGATTTSAFLFEPSPPVTPSNVDTLKLMTYNIQQGVDGNGEMAYDKQLAVIKQINPDILGLQESDTARISGDNSDVVRYFANRLTGLNYYSFYGPRTVTGTYGAAVLSKYPIISAKTFFTYSDVDEIGTTEVKILVGNITFNVFINHPAGNDDAKLAHMQALMTRVNATDNVISMGDFNTPENSTFYNMSVATLKDTWRDYYPSTVLPKRIDYIFVSEKFNVTDAGVITMPQSHSDHDTYWAEITW